jgi:hypothetical protein
MRETLAALLLSVPALAGCQALVGDDRGVECRSADDCFPFQLCDVERARCVDAPNAPGSFAPDATPDGRTSPADLPDLRPIPPDAAPDGPVDPPNVPLDVRNDPPDARDAEPDPPDLPDLMPPDVGVLGIYAPAGNCFDNEVSGPVAESAGAAVPRSLCSDEALLWTVTEPDGTTALRLRQGAAENTLTHLPRGAEWMLREAVLLVALPNDAFAGAVNVYRADLTGGLPRLRPVAPSAAPQWHLGRGPGLTSFIQRAPDGVRSEVRLHFDDDRVFDCGADGHRQWGLVVGEDYVAWFEQPVAGGPTELVATRGLDCTQRVALTLPGVIDSSERLLHDDATVFWMAVDAATGRRIIHTADAHDLRAGAMPLNVQNITLRHPVEMAAHDRWLLLSSFDRNAYRLHLYDLVSGMEQSPLGQGSARAPSLSGTYALWAQQSAGEPWEIRYAQLPPRR